MASGPDSRVEQQPPTLPVKKHRHSSAGSDSVLLSTAGIQQLNEVFPEPTDCHAAQCPIHQRYDVSKHQERFFSDCVPPPVPKKKLIRTLSLPGTNALSPSPLPPLSPLSPLLRRPQNFDNPVYMMAPISDSYIHEETEDFKPVREVVDPSPSFSQLSFDTPDQHLSFHLNNFIDQHVVADGMQHRHLLFLRSMAQRVEDRSLFHVSEREIRSLQPQDFLLFEGSKPKSIGNKTYYSLHSPKFPGRALGLRVLKETNEAPSGHNHNTPPHVNVQEGLTHFQPSSFPKKYNSESQDPSTASFSAESDWSSSKAPVGGSTEGVPGSFNSAATVESFLQRGCFVSVERDLPHATLEDFVQGSCSLQITQCQDYDRQVCVLVLQVLLGCHHLYNSTAPADLRPQEIFLVWSSWGGQKGENLLKDASQGRSSKQEEVDLEYMEERRTVQVLWKRYGAPRVVLMKKASAFSSPQLLTSIKSQIGILIHFCLRPPEISLSSHSTLFQSSYRRGLLHLSTLLQRDNGPQMLDIMSMLQVLLWGPQISIFSHRDSSSSAVQNWLTVKRALMVMKLAEKGLFQDQSVLDWEDCMCLKYLSFTDSETVVGVATQLWNTLNADSGL